MEPEVKKEHKYLPVLITVLVMLLVSAGAVAGTWYYMDQQAQKTEEDNAKQVAELQKQIDDLNKTVAAKSVAKTTASSAATTTTVDEVAVVKAKCTPTDKQNILSGFTYVENSDGKFATCGIAGVSGGGAGIFYKKIDGTWTQIYAGNGGIEDATILKYRIPSSLYPHKLF